MGLSLSLHTALRPIKPELNPVSLPCSDQEYFSPVSSPRWDASPFTYVFVCYLSLGQVLENAGIMRNIKRVAGASAGAIIATLIALGYDSRELREFLEQDLRRILVGELTLSVYQYLYSVKMLSV